MLEVIGAGVSNTITTDFVALFRQSTLKTAMDVFLSRDGVARPSPTVPALTFSSKRAATEWTLAALLTQRFLRLYWRTLAYNLSRFVSFLVLALVFGLSPRELDYTTYRGVNSGVGMLFLAIMFTGVVIFKSVKPLMFEDRNAFYSERAAQTYNALWYFVGASIAEVPYVFGSVLVFSAVFFPMVGLSGALQFAQFWLHLGLHVLVQVYLGQLLAFLLSTLEFSATIGTLVSAITFLFMGYNPPSKLIPVGYKWLHNITPAKYTLAFLNSAMFGNCDHASDVACHRLLDAPPRFPPQLSVAQYVDVVFHGAYRDIWTNFAIILGFIVFFRLLAALALLFVNHQKR